MVHLKKLRIVLSVIFFLPILLFFLDFTGKLPIGLHQFLAIQWVPALLSLNLVVIIILLALSLLFGRLYCSSICPLGILQDIIAWKAKFFKKKKKFRFDYAKPQNVLRYSILTATVIAFLFGSSVLVLLFDPYSTFGRIITQIIRPLIIWSNNGLAAILNSQGNYALYKIEQFAFVPLIFFVAAIFFIKIVEMSIRNGRLYCNTLCPVGAFLGLLSKVSIFHITFKETSCNKCGACAKQCKSQCIDSEAMKVDDSRCVTCFNCLSACKKGGIKYELRYNKKEIQHAQTPSNEGRRTFLLASGAALSTMVFAGTSKVLGSKQDSILLRKPIMPPGAKSLNHFNAHCTGCQLCVTKCPMQVLKPSTLEYGMLNITQPHLAFSTHIFCTFDCNICSTICPTAALKPLTIPEKKLTQIGVAKLRLDMCQVITHNTDCGACSEHCPTQAVHMIPYKNGLTQPQVTPDLCIGCGGCESICPVRPYQAIYVEGVDVQRKARKPEEAKKFEKKIDDFGF